MKKNILYFAAMSTLLLASISISSCRKDPENNNYQAAKDNATAETMFDDVFKQAQDGTLLAEDSAGGTKMMNSTLSSCATVTITPFDLTTFPKTIIIDFGSTNCLGDDGRYRRGQVNVVTTGWYRDSLSVITVTPNNYYVNDNKVQGVKTITNNGHNTAGNLNYTIIVANGSVTTSDGTISWNSTRHNEWIEGESTIFNPWDDVYLITGGAEGTTIEGEEFIVTIVSALKVKIGCRWITEGSLTLVSEDLSILVDYGTGACDANATVTLNGNVYNIVMM